MGLFDDLHVEYPLPDNCPLKDFQTKSFDEPYLNKYIITKKGRLLVYVGDAYEDTNYHGDLAFYGNHTDGFYVIHYEYRARFTEGQLVRISRVVPV